MPPAPPNEVPDVLAYGSTRAWLAAFGLPSRALAERLGGRHWTGYARMASGAEELTPELARRIAGRLGLDPTRTEALALLAQRGACRVALGLPPETKPEELGLVPLLRDLVPATDAGRRARRLLLDHGSTRPEEDLAEALATPASPTDVRPALTADTRAARLAAHRATEGFQACVARARGARQPTIPASQLPDHLAGVRRFLEGLPAAPELGRRACLLTLHQGADASVVAAAAEALQQLGHELAGMDEPGGVPTSLLAGAAGVSAVIGAGAAPPAPVHELGDAPLHLHAELHHGAFVRARWGDLDVAARVRAEKHGWPVRGARVPVALIGSLLRDLPPDHPDVLQARPRLQRLRAGDAARVEGLRPEEVPAAARAMEVDELLLSRMVARDLAPTPDAVAAVREAARLDGSRALQGGTLAGHGLALIVYELLQCCADAGDPAWIAAHARPAVTLAEAQAAWSALRTLGVVRLGPDGRVASVATGGLSFTRGAEAPPVDERLRRVHLDVATRLDRLGAGPATTLAATRLPAAALPAARRRMREVLRALQATAERRRGAWDRVVVLHAWLWPEDG